MPELSIIIPVLNERDNIRPLIENLRSYMTGVDWEVVFVDDDSPDGTAEVCRLCAIHDPRVRVIQRIGRRGLASACVEGMLSTASPWLAVMDGDLQHDPSVLPRMFATAKEGDYEVVVGSRNAEGGAMGDFSPGRVKLSHLGRRLSSIVLKTPLSDPMSGYFVVSRRYLDEVVRDLSGVGFKILLDMIASSRRVVRLAEVPYTFRLRERGASKLDTGVGIEFLLLIVDKLAGDFIPVRFGLYALVGLTGIIVHLGVLASVLAQDASIVAAQAIATVAAVVSNFFLNNRITFRDRQLRGWRSICRGLFWYMAACSVGAFVNVATTRLLADGGTSRFAAGAIGMCISAVWNYGAASVLSWKIERRRALRRRGAGAQPDASVAAERHA